MSDDENQDAGGEDAGEKMDQSAVDDVFDDAPADGGSDDAASGGDGSSGMDLGEIAEDEALAQQDSGRDFAVGEPMANDVTAIYDIPVQISAVLGRSTMQVSQLLKLGRGAVVELDRKVGEAIDIYVNNRLVARGEVVVVEDKLGVTMTEIVKSDRS
jgi:flagellar motor switch protein FliN/FliY